MADLSKVSRPAKQTGDPLTVGLVQITEPMDTLYYLPYSIGLLETYVMHHSPAPSRYQFLPPVIFRTPQAEVLPRLARADVLGFSIHVWNCQYTLHLAQAAKARNPKVLTLFGGPHVPDLAEAFLREHPYVDVCVHGEGEEVLLGLLESLPLDRQTEPKSLKAWENIPGISWLDPQGQFHSNGKAPRIRGLDDIPSPYLNGYFEPLLRQYPEQKWVGIWESNRGCPFSCAFCDWGTINSKVLRFDLERLQAEIDWFGSHGLEFVYCTDANFGILPRDIDLAQRLVKSRLRYGYPLSVLVQMTKNQTERAFQAFKVLTDAGMLPKIPLSLQSVTPDVLKEIKRDNISLEMYQELLKRFVNAGISTYTDVLVGLPGETFESFGESISRIITQGQHEDIRFWNAYLLPNAEMSQPDYRQRHGIESVTIPYKVPFSEATEPVDGIQEMLEMVVQTHQMPRADWARMRALAWMTQILYFSGFMQPPLLLIQALTGISHKELLLCFFEKPLPAEAQILGYMRNLLMKKAHAILGGDHEYMVTASPGSETPIYLPTQVFVMTELFNSPYLSQAYGEAHMLLQELLQTQGKALPANLLKESLLLAHHLFKASHPQFCFELNLSYNLYGCYQAILKGQPVRLEAGAWQVTRRPDALGQLQISEAMRVEA